MDIRLLVLDVDGTIAGHSNQVSKPVRQAIQIAQARGIQVAIATGRMYRSALRFHRSVNSDLPLLAYNGAWIQDPSTHQLHRHLPVSPTIALDLLNYFEQPQWLPHLGVNFYLDDRLYVRQITSQTKKYGERSGVEAIAVGDLRTVVANGPTKVLAMSEDTQVINQLIDSLQYRYSLDEVYLTQSTPTFFEATHPQATKGTATRYLAEELLGIQAGQVMAIGDNYNDVSMLTYAGLSIAMGDAPADVKEIARWVAPGVGSDGAAVAIEKFLL